MILRHDLQLAFLHIPKCAGKSLRNLFKLESNINNCTDLWNYSYSHKVHRYVDRAHLPSDDLVHFKEFRHLREYKAIAACRHPYLRLASAIKEYYRQRSKMDEERANEGKLSRDDQLSYLRALPMHLAMLDPRYIHALPMRRFSHYGKRCLVNHWLRCEQLRKDWQALVREQALPSSWIEAADGRLMDDDPLSRESLGPAADVLILVANQLYRNEFRYFGYEKWKEESISPADRRDLAECWKHTSSQSHEPQWIHQSKRLEWHWGPRCARTGHLPE
jgi:hypothetical protein